MWHCKYSVFLGSKVKFDETYMKMSKYENSLFPYSLCSTIEAPATFFVNPMRQLPANEKFCSQNCMANAVKFGEIREELSTSHFLTRSLKLIFS